MTEPNIAFVANLLADPSRAAMCLALVGGEARPAGELAARAGVSAQTASNHLAKLIAGRILRVEQQGRWRYYRLAGVDVLAPRARDRRRSGVGAGARAEVPRLDRAPAARGRSGGHGAGEGGTRPRLGTTAAGNAGDRRDPAGAGAAQEAVQPAMGGETMITLSIRYTIDARKRSDFERYARALGGIIPRCGGDLVGYWLPTKFAGPTNVALALIDFPSLAAYEQYRERLAKDDDNNDSVRRAEESGCILVEDRAFLERV
jgi:DNA-binding transcriptional ArsR family regulator